MINQSKEETYLKKKSVSPGKLLTGEKIAIKESDLPPKEHFVYLIEDGTDFSSGRNFKVDIMEYLNRYNFETRGVEITDPQKRYFLTLTQDDFEKRGFLELLHDASLKLKHRLNNAFGDFNVPEDSEIAKHKNEFTHLFFMDGAEITSLREIPREEKYLVCCMDRQFMGILDTEKLVSFQGSKLVKRKNIQNCLFNKTYQWMKDKMVNWTEENEKVEGPNKLFEINKHLQSIAPPAEHQSNPYAQSKAYMKTIQ